MSLSGMETTKAGRAENQAKMTWFCTQNIPTFVLVNFLFFAISIF